MESLLSGIAGKLLGELCSPFITDFGKSWGSGTKDEFEKLKGTLSAIKAVLLDAEEKQTTNRLVEDWLKKIKLVFYEVEDLLLEVSTEGLKRHMMTRNNKVKKVCIFFSRSNQLLYHFKMGYKVKLIRQRLDAIASDRDRFKLTERQAEMQVTREETHSFVHTEKFVGREEDKRIVMQYLFKSDDDVNVSVISIVGIGGLGKTTLAQSIYSSEEVEDHFELMIWVCVSNLFDVKVICGKIIESATGSNEDEWQMDRVKNELKRAIDGKKYLLVLDDVWNESPNEWMKLQDLLMGGAKGSKILITARAEIVARAAKSIATHPLKGLSDEESWLLFKQVAFRGGLEPENSKIVGIGKEVVEKCVGVPLAIRVIGSTLSLKEKEKDWLNFKRNDLHRITRDKENGIVPILKLSYDYLSPPLKRCFAYCAVFPKDYEIVKEKLICMWIAQGFVHLDGTARCLEEVGEQHFMDLLDRSFIMVNGTREHTHIFSCKLHDLMHDLAQSIGGNECVCLDSDANNIDETTRHVWVPEFTCTNLFQAKKLRTFVAQENQWGLDKSEFNRFTRNFKYMRVLGLQSLDTQILPRSVDELGHLSYLDLSGGFFGFLPQSICSLYNLQTLILSRCEKLTELPERMKNLVSLRHLDIAGCWKLRHMPHGLGELTCLRTLSEFIFGPDGGDYGELSELKSLVNLRGKLRILELRGLKVEECKSDHSDLLTQMKFVESLELSWCNTYEVEEEEANLLMFECLKPHSNLETLYISGYRSRMFPNWMDKGNIGFLLQNIVDIDMYECRSCENLPTLGLLPSLRKLSLRKMNGIKYLYDEEEEKVQGNNVGGASTSSGRVGGRVSHASSKSPQQLFPSLKLLFLDDMPNLTNRVGPTSASSSPNKNSRHFPVLEKLIIYNCPGLVADLCEYEDGNQIMNLSSVLELDIRAPDMVTFPAWLQNVPNLQTLALRQFFEIVTLPEWICDLTSLQELRLEKCWSLSSIPDCMRRLTSLQRMVITSCPSLFSGCEKGTGEDWHNIAHIPYVYVDTYGMYFSHRYYLQVE